MTKDVEHYHRKFLEILRASRVYQSGDSVLIPGAGHEAIRALVEEIHDQGYVLGQLHADGIFPEGGEVEVAELEDRLGIDELKAQARSGTNPETWVSAVDRLKVDLEAAGIPVHDPVRDHDSTDRSEDLVAGRLNPVIRGTGFDRHER